jgi:SAM-dependent methyltransferase
VSDLHAKYAAVAEDYSARDYADADRYYARRADVVVAHGPRLAAGSTLLDIACGDGGLGRHLLTLGIDYRGVDATEAMVEVARRTLGARVSLGTFDYAPPEPVDAVTIFRSLYLVPDRRAFLERVRGFTRVKLVFDFDPRTQARDGIEADLAAAGWRHVRIRPFLTPQRSVLPAPAQRALWALEPLPGAALLTRVRFPLVVSACPA